MNSEDKIALGLLLGLWAATGVHAQEYAVGADLSGLKQAEDRGFVFKDNNVPKPGLQIFKDHGYNWIRLHLFHTPTMAQNLQYTIALAQAAKKLGFKFLPNYHYSDTWADPKIALRLNPKVQQAARYTACRQKLGRAATQTSTVTSFGCVG